MKALVKLKSEQGLWLQDIEEPAIGPNDVRIAIRKTAICGTDMHIYQWDNWAQATIPVPMTVGHEFCGDIVELGSEVAGMKIGDRVSGEGHVTCGHCRNCRAGRRHLCRNTVGIGVNRPGAFAEYLSMPADNVFVLPEEITDDMGAILDPLGNATHAALSFDMVGEDVLITGAGPIGLFSAAIARYVGARHVVITDINPQRLALAEKLDVTRTVNVASESLPQVMGELGMTEGFDVGLEMSGQPSAFSDMLSNMVHGGRVALMGIPSTEIAIDWNQVIFKGLILKGIYGREMFETWYKMANMIRGGLDVSPVVTHHFGFEQFQSGFDAMIHGDAAKVILNWR